MSNALDKMIEQLEKQVQAELSNPDIRPDQHGRPIGYHNGCRGPLCKKINRDRQRKPGQSSTNPWLDTYLEARLEEHKAELRKKEVAA